MIGLHICLSLILQESQHTVNPHFMFPLNVSTIHFSYKLIISIICIIPAIQNILQLGLFVTLLSRQADKLVAHQFRMKNFSYPCSNPGFVSLNENDGILYWKLHTHAHACVRAHTHTQLPQHHSVDMSMSQKLSQFQLSRRQLRYMLG
jgi:hypothetical protein